MAVGVVVNRKNEILLAKRPTEKYMGGYWEFPGGKVEEAESTVRALARELQEEVSITLVDCEKLIEISHNYPDKHVLLEVYLVTAFAGNAVGLENQEIRWVNKDDLEKYSLPPANKPIVTAIHLPREVMITGAADTVQEFMCKLEASLRGGINLVQLRAPELVDDEYLALCAEVRNRFSAFYPGVKFFANCSPTLFPYTGFECFHLNSLYLRETESRKDLPDCVLLSASVHNKQELEQAKALGVDFVYISPVKETSSHPHVSVLGWDKFSDLVAAATVPVYALGGLVKSDVQTSILNGAQGVAAISEYWSDLRA